MDYNLTPAPDPEKMIHNIFVFLSNRSSYDYLIGSMLSIH